jgi:hypothetical protein
MHGARGASLKEVQEILGHKTMTMTLGYARLSQEHKRKAVNLFNGLTAPLKISKKSSHTLVTTTVLVASASCQLIYFTGRDDPALAGRPFESS